MKSEMVPRLRGRIRAEDFGGLLFCVEPMRILAFNATGHRLACLIDGVRNAQKIAADFAEELTVASGMVQGDVDAFLRQLDGEGLLDWSV